jgi:putative ABC transport system permease protein
MLQLINIGKEYISGGILVNALKDVNVTFRKNEFVAVLGPSGCGKTTLLNIIGGLDQYTGGDVLINGTSTKQFKETDWDAYRNNSVGFVFQSYNLIPHQDVLSNVELALTLSGVGAAERRKKAIAALESVSLGDQMHKKPNQLSGGQMQRVAIARALVNDPEILLADEPTGALDTETSLMVMEILKEISKERLVIMVTHNQELAETYATRIVRLKDGEIIGDDCPTDSETNEKQDSPYALPPKRSMSFLTALSLSKSNLFTKRGRTILTAFAGSIGIIGIALILSLSTGVNTYITDLQSETMVSYPITINSEAIDIASIMANRQQNVRNNFGGGDLAPLDPATLTAVYADPSDLEKTTPSGAAISTNNLNAFKEYLDDPNSEIQAFIGENGVVYSYDVRFSVYAKDPTGVLVAASAEEAEENTRVSPFAAMQSGAFSGLSGSSSDTMINFEEMLPGSGQLISPVVANSYELLEGNWPTTATEVVLVLNEDNTIASKTLYQLGFLPQADYLSLKEQLKNGEEINFPETEFAYADVLQKQFYLLPASDFYQETEVDGFQFVGEEIYDVEELLPTSIVLTISGIIRPLADANFATLNSTIAYTSALTDLVIERTNASDIVVAQEAKPDTDILTGLQFAPANDDDKVADAVSYLRSLSISEKAAIYPLIMRMATTAETPRETPTEPPTAPTIIRAMGSTEVGLATALDQYLLNPNKEVMLNLYDSYITVGSYSENMKTFGKVQYDAPTSISIYADSFDAKDSISLSITNYNKSVEESDRIVYTDYVALLTSSITSIINVISYVLIAFVAVSLIVSSLMIGIITHISVLERTKEIGILRAIGASRKDISRVFNAETFIIGLFSGVLGIALTLLLQFPLNRIIRRLTETNDVSATLPLLSAVLLIGLSIALTLFAGIFPANAAAKKDPVVALRTE